MSSGTAETEQLAAQMDELMGAFQTMAEEVRRRRELREGRESHVEAAGDAVSLSRRETCWLFVPAPSGYSLVTYELGEPLLRGDPIRLDGREYRVAVVAGSPIRDGRKCLYLDCPA
jgi:hypothetical protein